MKIKWLFGTWITALFVFCSLSLANDGDRSSANGMGTTIEVLTPQEAYTMVQKNKSNKDFVILDVRTPEEFASGHIEGAINIDYNSGKFENEIGKLDNNNTYLVYCRAGSRSDAAAKIMTERGFKHIYRIKGDIVQWQTENLPLVH